MTKHRGRLRMKMRKALVIAQEGRCHYCKWPMDTGARGTKSTLDHVVPKVKGGQTTLLNMVAACQTCNRDKADMSAEEFIAKRGNHPGRGLPAKAEKLARRTARREARMNAERTAQHDSLQ